MKKIVLFGAGGFARETAYLIERINNVRAAYELLGFIVDDAYYRDGLEINGYPVLGTRQWLIAHKNEVVCTLSLIHILQAVQLRSARIGLFMRMPDLPGT